MIDHGDDHGALERELTAATAPDRPLPDLATAAQRAGLLDIAYAKLDSPVGTLLLAGTETGLLRVAYIDATGEDPVLEDLAARISPRIMVAPARLDAARRELDEYFAGARHRFAVRLDWQLTAGFSRRILEMAQAIPYGGVSTYREVAASAGSPRGARAAGNALGRNPLPIIVPCHRVLHAGGGLGGYTGGLERKRLLLELERGQRSFTLEGSYSASQ